MAHGLSDEHTDIKHAVMIPQHYRISEYKNKCQPVEVIICETREPRWTYVYRSHYLHKRVSRYTYRYV